MNADSIVSHNGADVANGGSIGRTVFPLAGRKKNNVIGSVHDQVVDAENCDFRPKTSSSYYNESVGPYVNPKGKRLEYYWIPGRQIPKASQPIPKNGSMSVNTRRDALMWLGGYKASSHDIYIGQNESRVNEANKSSDEFQMNMSATKNIFYLDDYVLEAGETYYWRVDAISRPHAHPIKGNVWQFITE